MTATRTAILDAAFGRFLNSYPRSVSPTDEARGAFTAAAAPYTDPGVLVAAAEQFGIAIRAGEVLDREVPSEVIWLSSGMFRKWIPERPVGDCSAAAKPDPADEVSAAFEQFCAHYPTAKPTQAAQVVRVWEEFQAACRGISPERIVAAAVIFAAETRRSGIEDRYIPSPWRWLRERRYEPLPTGAGMSRRHGPKPEIMSDAAAARFGEACLTCARELSAGAEASRAAFREEILDAVRREFSSGAGRPCSSAAGTTVFAVLRGLGRTLGSALRRAFRSGDRAGSEPRPV